MYWARYVLVDQALRGGGMRSTECHSRFILQIPPTILELFKIKNILYTKSKLSQKGGGKR